MKMLYITHKGRGSVINMSLCERIEIEDETLLFYVGSSTRAYALEREVPSQRIMSCLRGAFAPASEGRMNTVLGIAMYLDLDAL